MAVTKVLARKGRLDVGIHYVLNGDKTNEQILTAYLNCDPGHACRQMLDTKRAMGKTDGVQYYHIIQSFKPGEVTPELALEIAREFAAEHLPGYQAVIGVHVDKEHIHAHTIFNSVNADTGEKYHSNARSYYSQIRAISDRLCREHGLSVIMEGKADKAVSYIEWLRQSRGQPTFRAMLEADLREAIEDANDRALNIQKDGTGKEIWMPVARNGLQNKEPIEILAQFNGEIRGIYNYYRLARNVSVLNKFCYVMEYSMYKTIARKMRCSAAKVKKKYTRDRIFGIEYETKHGIKRAEFYHNGFRKSAPSKLDMDTTPDYRYSIRPKEVIARFMTGYCELCCKNELPVMIYQVKNLKSLSGNEPWEQFMLKKRRKTLIVCEDCYKTITNS